MKNIVKGLCLAVVVLSLPGCRLAGDWGAGIKRVIFIPEVLGKLAQSQGKAVKLTDAQTQELLECLSGPARQSFVDNKYVTFQKDIWAVYWENNDGFVQTDKVYLVRYSVDDTRYEALAFDSSGELTETVGGRRGSASYEPLDKGPIQ